MIIIFKTSFDNFADTLYKMLGKLVCFAVTEGADGCHFVRNRCWMFQLPGQVTGQGENPLPWQGQNKKDKKKL